MPAALNADEYKIPHVKKTDYNTKIWDTESKFFTTSDYNKFTNKIIDNN